MVAVGDENDQRKAREGFVWKKWCAIQGSNL